MPRASGDALGSLPMSGLIDLIDDDRAGIDAIGAHLDGLDPRSRWLEVRRLRPADDAVHIVMTDHRIQRQKPAGDPLAEKTETRDSPATAYRGEVLSNTGHPPAWSCLRSSRADRYHS
jgi:hypothetical protein